MLLRNVQLVSSGKQVDILIESGKIESVSEHISSSTPVIEFKDAIAFPGLINSHDHLDFNLFPQLGNKKYNNYVEWGDDIHQQNKGTIDKVLKVPEKLRVQWGMYKNLFCGVTTVVNHGPKLSVPNDIISIWQDCNVLHSVQLDKKWKLKLNNPFVKKTPFAIHIGEGTDEKTHKEIDELLKWNLFKRELIGIHAIAMNERQAEGFKAIVWCPDSNYFLIGKTAQIDKLKSKTKIVFGTDSTVSAHWNIWEHLRLARQQNMVSDAELFEMLTTNPSKIWPIKGKGAIEKNYSADIIIARKKAGNTSLDSFYSLNPEDILLVMHEGNIMLFDEEIAKQIDDTKGFSKVNLNNKTKYVYGDLPALIKSIKGYYPEASFPVTIA